MTNGFLLVIAFAVLNRARGSRLFELTSSTGVSRIVATFLMAAATTSLVFPDRMLFVMPWVWVSLLVWCTPAWDAYWSAEIGDDPKHSRLWGLGMMTLRMALVMPCLTGLAVLSGHTDRALFANGALLLGLPYYLLGFIVPVGYVIFASELTVGAILGALVFAIIS